MFYDFLSHSYVVHCLCCCREGVQVVHQPSIMFRLTEVALSLEEEETLLPLKVAEYVQRCVEDIKQWRIVRSSIDARRKGRVLRMYTVEFSLDDAQLLCQQAQQDRRLNVVTPQLAVHEVSLVSSPKTVVVVGMGPAGLFSALWLAKAGQRVILVDRGQPVEQRVADVESFWQGGPLNENSNVQFGEGGAGTFSDGKLTTRVKNPLTVPILQTFVDLGAPEEILIQAKPHIGTNRLRHVLRNFRKQLQQLGVELRFDSCVTDIQRRDNTVEAVTINDDEVIRCDVVILAIGHSARDTYALLEQKEFKLQAKPFALGVRVEHPTELINKIQYGIANHPRLPTADYNLAYNDKATGRGIYSFCMCPGGDVVQSSSESEAVVVNGMSNYKRDGEYSNSALVVAVRPEDFGDSSPLAGVRFQQHWEHQAFIAGGRSYQVPAQNMMDFLGKGAGGDINSSCRSGVSAAQLSETLPDFVVQGLQSALPLFDRKMRGFVTREATLTGIESRTSAPVRIVRDSSGQAIDWLGVYPVGEGAGYAGGIMSAAIDGVSAALLICQEQQ
jgi:uncharacterized FAD-dependent dehydrogenase